MSLGRMSPKPFWTTRASAMSPSSSSEIRSAGDSLPSGRDFQNRIARAGPEMGLILLSVDDVRPAIKRKVTDTPQSYAQALSIATLACGATTALAAWLLRVFDPSMSSCCS